LYKTLVILGVASVLNAATTYTSTIQGTRVVSGKFNESNTILITVTLTGGDAANTAGGGKNDQYVVLYAGFGSTSTVSTIDKNLTTLADVSKRVSVQGFEDNVATISVNYNTLSEANGSNPNGKYVDFKIAFTGATTTYFQVTPVDDNPAHLIDTDDVYLNNYSYPNYSYTYFNEQKITYQPDETLFQTPSTYQSYVKFLGDANGSGADNGNSHIYNFSGSDLNTGSNITKDPIVFSSGGDLVDGAGYDIIYYLYDVAGNYTGGWQLYSNRIYDKTVPRISSATSGTSNGTHKKGDQILVTLSFSEAVYTTGVMNIVYTMDGDDYTFQAAAFGSRSSPYNNATWYYTVQDG